MSLAVDTVLNSGLRIQHAAQDHDLPRSTLSDDVSTCILPGTLSGPGRYLSHLKELFTFCWNVRPLGTLDTVRW